MYFDFEDYRPEIPTLDRSLTRLEIILLTVVVHLLIVISIIAWPHLAVRQGDVRRQEGKLEAAPREEQERPARATRSSSSSRRRSKCGPRCRRSWPKLVRSQPRAQTMEKAPNPKNDVAVLARQHRGEDRQRRAQGTAAAAEQPSAPAKATTARHGAPADPNALRLPQRARRDHRAQRAVEESDARRTRRRGVLSDAISNVQKYSQGESLQNVQGNGDFGPSIQFDTQGRGLRTVAAPLHRADPPQLVRALRGDVAARPRRARVQGPQGRQHHRAADHAAVVDRRVHQVGVQRDQAVEPDRAAAARVSRRETRRSSVTFYFNETPPGGGSQ